MMSVIAVIHMQCSYMCVHLQCNMCWCYMYGTLLLQFTDISMILEAQQRQIAEMKQARGHSSDVCMPNV